MSDNPYVYNTELLKRVRESGLIIKDLAGIARIPMGEMYEILAGLWEPPESAKTRIASALGCRVHEIFREGGR